MRWVYVLATWCAYLLLWPFLAILPKTRRGFWQRLGFYRVSDLPKTGHPRLWFHGASAGDILALAPMIERLRIRYPNAAFVASTITNTGHAMAAHRLQGKIDAVVYAPWDLLGATQRAARAIDAQLLVLEYAELWPNLIHAVRDQGGKIALTNGRFSPHLLPRYRLLFALSGQPLDALALLMMRDADEAKRAQALGVEPSRIAVTGNTKFDALGAGESDAGSAEALRLAMGIPNGAQVLVAGSTHVGEEEEVLKAYAQLLKNHPHLRLVLAPRYFNRARRIATMSRNAGFPCALRSEGNPSGVPVVVLDTMGELKDAYQLATVVFVGGSFTARGGQNILEPASRGKPVFFGPHMENFEEAVRLLLGRGAVQVKDGAQLAKVVDDLLRRPDELMLQGQRAAAAIREVRGAAEANAVRLTRLLEA